MKTNIFKRNFHINPYQKPIILIAIVPLLATCAFLTVLTSCFFNDLENFLAYGNMLALPDLLQKWLAIIVGFIWAFFILNFIFTYWVSSNLVGAFSRIIKELDNLLAQNKHSKISCRKNDYLANDLIQRINLLIERLPVSKT